jgi:hypothetical protein
MKIDSLKHMSTSTQTCFGRNSRYWVALEELLKDADFKEHKMLSVGGGLAKAVSGCDIFKKADWAKKVNRYYTWECYELAANLMNLRKPWQMTVVDNSEYVCKIISNQKEILITDISSILGPQKNIEEYAKQFLQAYGENDYGAQEAASANIMLDKTGISGGRFKVFKTVRIPEVVKNRIRVINANIEQFEPNESYNVIVSFHAIGLYTNENVADALWAKLTPGGLMAINCLPPDWHISHKEKLGKGLCEYFFRKPSSL